MLQSHPIMTLSPTCLPWSICHGNGHCLAMGHWTFRSYGRMQCEHVNQLWWNLVQNNKLGPWLQSRDQILKFLKFKRRTAAMLEHIGNAITRLLIDRFGWNLGGRIPSCSDMSAMMRLPWRRMLLSLIYWLDIIIGHFSSWLFIKSSFETV